MGGQFAGSMPGQFPGSMSGQRPRAISGSMPRGPGSGGNMTSSELIEAGLRLRRMEERAYGGCGGSNLSPGAGTGFESGVPKTIGVGAMNEDPVDLASEMMRRDPGMEPRRALELARSFQNRAA